jgi:hypothetical protein
MIFTRRIILKPLFLLFLFSFGFVWQSTSQTHLKGRIIEKDSKLPIPFASIVYQKQSLQKGSISDIYGRFEINESNISTIIVSCVGYKQAMIKIASEVNPSNVIVELETAIQELNEIFVTPANNPAIRIIKNVLENKRNNNFENYKKYSYQCYFKTIIDFKLSDEETQHDSLVIDKSKPLKNRAPFISECVMSCLKINKRIEYKINAQKTSGFKDPMLVQTFVSFFQNSISFYNNSISLLEIPTNGDRSIVEYVSPLSDDCLSGYNFELEDSYLNSSDSIFIVNFHPKKAKNFNGLKGTLFISSNGFAIKNIVAEPSEKGLIGFKFRQDYEFINNKWFPTKLDEEIGWIANKVNKNTNAYPVYLITSRIDSIKYDLEISTRKINLDKVYLDESSLKKSDLILSSARPDSLSLREQNTYHFLDSIGEKKNFDYWAKLYPKLMVGKIPIKWFDLDLNSFYNHNTYEGSRLGIGLLTNEKLSKVISLGGFVGYGFRDEKLKYGGQVIFDLNKDNEQQLKLSYQNNLKELGFEISNDYSKVSLSEYIRSNMGSLFDSKIEKKIEFGFRTLRFLKVSTSLSLNEISPTYLYSFKDVELTNYYADEIQFSAKYAVGEELGTIGNQRVVNNEGNPIINIIYKRGTNLFNKSSFQYNRIEATIDFMAYKGRVGQSNFRLATGFIDSSLPYGLLFTCEGSKNKNIPLIINNSFQTMSPYEFLSDKYMHLFFSHNFGSLLINTKKFKPQFIIVQNAGWGALKNFDNQGIDFNTKDKIYIESGLIINNILKLNYINMFYINFGVGGFYRYGNYGFDNFNENIALKLSMSVSLK